MTLVGERSDKDLVKFVDVGAVYCFNRNMSTCADHKINLLDGRYRFYRENGVTTGNAVATGLVCQF